MTYSHLSRPSCCSVVAVGNVFIVNFSEAASMFITLIMVLSVEPCIALSNFNLQVQKLYTASLIFASLRNRGRGLCGKLFNHCATNVADWGQKLKKYKK